MQSVCCGACDDSLMKGMGRLRFRVRLLAWACGHGRGPDSESDEGFSFLHEDLVGTKRGEVERMAQGREFAAAALSPATAPPHSAPE